MSSTVETAIDIRPFHVDIPDEALEDLRRCIANLIYFNELDKGCHFAAWEQPELFSDEIRAAFKSLR